jgi:hypothetical protein
VNPDSAGAEPAMTDHRESVPTDSNDEPGAYAIPRAGLPWLVCVPAGTDTELSPQLAQLILDVHTAVGDVVVDIDDDSAFAAAAAETGRRHHALGGATGLNAFGHAAGYIDLLLMHWPQPNADPRWLLLTCRTLLRNEGCLVVAVKAVNQRRVAALSALTGAASTAGLNLVDHIAVIDLSADGFLTQPGTAAERTPRVDADLLVFVAATPS